jgi:hypothetical protein
MSIDTRGRLAASGLRASTQAADTPQMLARMHNLRHERRRRGAVLAATALVLIAVAAVTVVREGATVAPAPAVNESQDTLRTCTPAPLINLECLSATRWQFHPFYGHSTQIVTSFVLPSRFRLPSTQPLSDLTFMPVDPSKDPTVVIIDHVAGVTLTSGPDAPGRRRVVADPTAGKSPESVATWVCGHRWIGYCHVSPAVVGGQPAERIDLTLRVNSHYGHQTPPILGWWNPSPRAGSGWNTWGQDDYRVAVIYLFRQPNGHLVAVVSYSVHDVADRGDELINSLKFNG